MIKGPINLYLLYIPTVYFTKSSISNRFTSVQQLLDFKIKLNSVSFSQKKRGISLETIFKVTFSR